jgi:hypothetical protein
MGRRKEPGPGSTARDRSAGASGPASRLASDWAVGRFRWFESSDCAALRGHGVAHPAGPCSRKWAGGCCRLLMSCRTFCPPTIDPGSSGLAVAFPPNRDTRRRERGVPDLELGLRVGNVFRQREGVANAAPTPAASERVLVLRVALPLHSGMCVVSTDSIDAGH